MLRAATVAAYVHAISDIPGVKVDVTTVALGLLVLGFYVWSAIGIKRGDPRGYRRLVRLSVVFGVIHLGTVAYNYTTIPQLNLIQGAYPLLWALIVPVPIGLAVLHLTTAFVAYRANAAPATTGMSQASGARGATRVASSKHQSVPCSV